MDDAAELVVRAEEPSIVYVAAIGYVMLGQGAQR